MHKLKQGIGRLKFARLPPHMLSRFLAVICVLKARAIIEFGKIKSNNFKQLKRDMIETLILLGCLYLSIRVTDYIENQNKQ